MNARYTKILLLIVVIIVLYKSFHYFQISNEQINQEEPHNKEKLKVSVHYEALCPDSKFFITYQLLPAFKDLHEYLILDLIPYGKAQTIEIEGQIEFHCQHNAVECFANKIHSCVIEAVDDPLIRLEYIACMIKDNTIPGDAGERCGNELNINFNPISVCANGIHGSELLKKHGEKTNSLIPSVKFIPTIELNNDQSLVAQAQILKDLKRALCSALKDKPTKC